MLNGEVARIFERMARVLAFKGEDRFRVMAYIRAIRESRRNPSTSRAGTAPMFWNFSGSGHFPNSFGREELIAFMQRSLP